MNGIVPLEKWVHLEGPSLVMKCKLDSHGRGVEAVACKFGLYIE